MPLLQSRLWFRAAAAGVAVWLAASSLVGQTPDVRRLKTAAGVLPGIDLGLAPAFTLDAIGGRRHRLPDGLAGLHRFPGRLIVKFRPDASAEARAAALASLRTERATAAPWGDFEVVAIDASLDPESAAAALAARPDVEYAQADYIAVPHYRPNDPLYAEQWNLPAMQLEQAWDINQGATSDLIVAVLDTGVAFDNAIFDFVAPAFSYQGKRYPALGALSVPFAAAPELGASSRYVAPRDFIWNDTDPVDLAGHGTHVAGTIGQLTNNGVGVAGVAFNVRLMPVKVLADQWDLIFDAPNVGTSSVVASGVRYAADNGAKVINMSLGFDGPATLPVIEDALNYAVSKGAVVVVSAGNSFEDGNPVEALAELAARIDGVISVGAVGRTLTRAFYSSSRSSVEVTAPGGDTRAGGSAAVILQQTYDPTFAVSDPLDNPVSLYRAPRFDVFRYDGYQGTSMAAPHVSGLVALLMQQGVTKPAAIEAAIKRYATDRGATGRDDDYGYGIVNARETLRGMGLVR
jgi:serine protease